MIDRFSKTSIAENASFLAILYPSSEIYILTGGFGPSIPLLRTSLIAGVVFTLISETTSDTTCHIQIYF